MACNGQPATIKGLRRLGTILRGIMKKIADGGIWSMRASVEEVSKSKSGAITPILDVHLSLPRVDNRRLVFAKILSCYGSIRKNGLRLHKRA
jgi:hypothetical protein